MLTEENHYGDLSLSSSYSGSSSRAPELSWDSCGGDLNVSASITFGEVYSKYSIVQEMQAELTKLKEVLENAQLELSHFNRKNECTSDQMLNSSSDIDTDFSAENDFSNQTECGSGSQFNANSSKIDNTLTNEAIQDIEQMDFMQVVDLSPSIGKPGQHLPSISGCSADGTASIDETHAEADSSVKDTTQTDDMNGECHYNTANSIVQTTSNTALNTKQDDESENEVNRANNLQMKNGGRRSRERKPKEVKPTRVYTCDNSHCKFASYVMNFKSYERMHVLYHTSKKPFGCEICLKRFPRKWNSKKHMQRCRKGML